MASGNEIIAIGSNTPAHGSDPPAHGSDPPAHGSDRPAHGSEKAPSEEKARSEIPISLTHRNQSRIRLSAMCRPFRKIARFFRLPSYHLKSALGQIFVPIRHGYITNTRQVVNLFE